MSVKRECYIMREVVWTHRSPPLCWLDWEDGSYTLERYWPPDLPHHHHTTTPSHRSTPGYTTNTTTFSRTQYYKMSLSPPLQRMGKRARQHVSTTVWGRRRLDLNKTRSLLEVHINSLTPPSPRRSVVVTRLIILVLLILIQFHFVCLQMDLSNNNILPAPPSRAAVGYQKTAAVTSRATGVERRGMTRSVVELEVCGEIYGLFCWQAAGDIKKRYNTGSRTLHCW